ncbi:MAG: hypothetical protein GEU94_08965 [Micromonosporaceae bacterium]|nr:hypothetical protein [Micromonosporaceae bacterium]
MAGHPLVGPATAGAVEEYLAAIAAELPGPRRVRDDALAELRDGLHDAISARTAAGEPAAAAASAVLAESGSPSVVAAAYAPELDAVSARRTAQALLATGPLLGWLWLTSLTPGRAPDALLRGLPPLAGLVALAAVAGVLAIVAAGPAVRWLPDLPHLPQRAVACACAAAICADLAVLTLAGARFLTQDAGLPWIAVIAVFGSAVRLTYSQNAARRHLPGTPRRA